MRSNRLWLFLWCVAAGFAVGGFVYRQLNATKERRYPVTMLAVAIALLFAQLLALCLADYIQCSRYYARLLFIRRLRANAGLSTEGAAVWNHYESNRRAAASSRWSLYRTPYAEVRSMEDDNGPDGYVVGVNSTPAENGFDSPAVAKAMVGGGFDWPYTMSVPQPIDVKEDIQFLRRVNRIAVGFTVACCAAYLIIGVVYWSTETIACLVQSVGLTVSAGATLLIVTIIGGRYTPCVTFCCAVNGCQYEFLYSAAFWAILCMSIFVAVSVGVITWLQQQQQTGQQESDNNTTFLL